MAQGSDYYLVNWGFATQNTSFNCDKTGKGNWPCEAPNACALDADTGRHFCCGSKPNEGASCWTFSTTTSVNTLKCEKGTATWSCAKNGSELCDLGDNHNCKSTSTNPLPYISEASLLASYSSLLAVNQSATFLPFNPRTMLPEAHSTLSGGSIAGIVVGSVLFVVALAAGVWILLKNRRNTRTQREQKPRNTRGDPGLILHPELDGCNRMELESNMNRQELAS